MSSFGEQLKIVGIIMNFVLHLWRHYCMPETLWTVTALSSTIVYLIFSLYKIKFKVKNLQKYKKKYCISVSNRTTYYDYYQHQEKANFPHLCAMGDAMVRLHANIHFCEDKGHFSFHEKNSILEALHFLLLWIQGWPV